MPTKTCQRCGSVLHQDDPGGFCPRCLVQAGIELSAASDPNAEAPWRGAAAERLEPGAGFPPVTGKAGEPGLSVVGQHFGDYEVIELIARGGMGVVYKARQKSLDRIVALKLMLVGPHAPPESVKRFRAEAIATAALQHPHIVAIHDVGSWESHHFLVMEFVEGRSLARVISDLGFQISNLRRTAGWLKTVAEAIHYAHERGILHRDLKPSNILIDARGQPLVTDFGLAKRFSEESGTLGPSSVIDLTLTGQVLGSPSYIPPEQASRKWGVPSRRSDVYALGAILYHTLTGRPPFVGEGLAETMHQVLNVEPIAPHVLNPQVPADLETVCLRCLEKQPGKRYATAQMLADELGRFLEGEPVLARPVGRLAKAWRWCRRNPLPAVATTAALLCLITGLAGVTWEWRRAEAQRARAEAGEQLARQRAYVSDINLAQQALAANNLARALELLDRHRPAEQAQSSKFKAQSRPDLRGWEWRYLSQQARGDAEGVIGNLRGGVRDLAASSNGRFLAASSEFGEVKAWDLAARTVFDLATEEGTQSFLAFSPDARWLAFTDQGIDRPGTIGFWDSRTRQRVAPIVDPHYVGPLGFSPDGRWFVYGVLLPDFRGRLRVLDFAARTQVRELDSQAPMDRDGRGGYALAFAPDGEQIVVAESDGRIKRWNFVAGTETEYVNAHQEGVTAMAIASVGHGGGTLATGASYPEKVIKLWNLSSLGLVGTLTNHQDWISDLKFSPDGRILASSSADQTIRLWDPVALEEKGVLRGHLHEVWRICFSTDGRKLFSGARDGTVCQWPVPAPPVRPAPEVTPTELSDLVLGPDLTLFAGLQRGGVCLGSTRDGRRPRLLEALGTNNTSLLFSCDGQHLFAGTRTGEIQVWSLNQERIERSLIGPADPVRQLRQDALGRCLFALHRTVGPLIESACQLQVWSTPAWRLQASWPHSRMLRACALSPDGRRLVTSQLPHLVLVWDTTTGQQTGRLDFAGRTSDLAFSPDGRFLAAGNLEGSVRIWEGPTLREVAQIRGHSRPVYGLAFSPDSRRLATASEGDEAIRLWDVVTWQPLITLGRTGADLSTVAFSPQGDGIAAVDTQGESEDLVLWKVPSPEQTTPTEEKQAGSE